VEPLYDRFADFYAAGPYPRYTRALIELFPTVQEHYNLPGKGSLLDAACGEGTFAVAMAKDGWQVTGIDQSERMLQHARRKPETAELGIRFLRRDMRSMGFNAEYDLVTCWFDSLNYLLQYSDLSQAFSSAYQALKPGGYYLMDMNTIYGLAFTWQQNPYYIQQDQDGIFEVHSTSYDYENQIASLHITGFVRLPDSGLWERMDEIHRERGYPVEQIASLLNTAGFEIIDRIGHLRDFSPPEPETPRVWFICRKPA